MFVTPDPSPIGESWGDVASLLLRQRERVVVAYWQLLVCRLFNESAYRHLDLQFYNLFACRNPTSPVVDASNTFRRMHSNYTILLDTSQEGNLMLMLRLLQLRQQYTEPKPSPGEQALLDALL